MDDNIKMPKLLHIRPCRSDLEELKTQEHF